MAEYIDRDLAIEKTDYLVLETCYDCEKVEDMLRDIPTADVIEIPKGATNGDMIKAMFPNANLGTLAQDDIIVNRNYSNNDDIQVSIPIKWWNAPYKRGSKDDSN